VVVLTTYADDESIIAALRAGTIGYLTKDVGRDHIRRALDAAAAGQAILDPTVQARLVDVAALSVRRFGHTAARRLIEREAEVLRLIAAGLSNTEIAARLYLSEAAVQTRINRIFAKPEAVTAPSHRLRTPPRTRWVTRSPTTPIPSTRGSRQHPLHRAHRACLHPRIG
jgi:DNA-binding NarL/FixJ family response regulator